MFVSTDKRDHVYGTMALRIIAGQCGLDRVDYTKSSLMLSEEIARTGISKTKNLDVLIFAHGELHLENFDSEHGHSQGQPL